MTWWPRVPRRLPRQQVVRQRQAVADRRLPFALQNLVVDHVDVVQQIVVVEGQRADDVRVVREDDEPDAIVAAGANERAHRILGRLEPGLAGLAVGMLQPSSSIDGGSISSCMLDDRSSSITMSRPRGLHRRLRVREHRLHQRERR